MSTSTGSRPSGTTTSYDTYEEAGAGYGWIIFSGVLLLIIGTINFIEGIAAISNAHFFVGGARYVIGDLNTWGWVALIVGVIQWLVAVGVFAKMQFARWAGVAVFGVNAVTQLLTMPAYPFWSLCIFAIDILGMYGLIAYGQREAS
ncbi:MAG: DUF7144 family membrane protein [Solirubrobacteraceae bacterium]